MKKILSIILPTYREKENIPLLADRIDPVLRRAGIPYEMVVVDDNSNDDIFETVENLKDRYPINLIVRIAKKRDLSWSVIEGLSHANGDILLVMDADLSHPPEKIPEMIHPLITDTADFVIGSRFVSGGKTDHFDFYRKLNARISRFLARPFTEVKDPMAGFFAFHRRLMSDMDRLNPIGYKIGLELLVKYQPERILEIPIIFQKRIYGKSKMNLREQLLYLVHICRLFHYKFVFPGFKWQ